MAWQGGGCARVPARTPCFRRDSTMVSPPPFLIYFRSTAAVVFGSSPSSDLFVILVLGGDGGFYWARTTNRPLPWLRHRRSVSSDVVTIVDNQIRRLQVDFSFLLLRCVRFCLTSGYWELE
jgi:hypothetical protein